MGNVWKRARIQLVLGVMAWPEELQDSREGAESVLTYR